MATVDMQFLIDRLDGIMQQSRRAFFGGRVQVDEAEIQQIIDEMKVAFPQEVKQARRVLQEREHIIKSAQDEAEQIVMLARQQAEYLTSEHGLMQEARQRSERMLRDAQGERDTMMEDIRQFAFRSVSDVYNALEALEDAIAANRPRVRKVFESLQEPQDRPADR